jgi:hypothetical protein
MNTPRRNLMLAAAALPCATLAPLPSAWAQAAGEVELAGVKYPPTVNLAGSALRLNGAGIRFRFVVRVYTAGLYLPQRASTPEAVLAQQGPKRLHVVMLREIDATELGKLFVRGMQDNSPREEFSKSIPGTLRMGEIFAAKKRMVPGENFSVDWVPGQGTTVLVNGRPQGEPVKEPEFFNALMRIWLGPNPADANLKEALLGQMRQGGTGTGGN